MGSGFRLWNAVMCWCLSCQGNVTEALGKGNWHHGIQWSTVAIFQSYMYRRNYTDLVKCNGRSKAQLVSKREMRLYREIRSSLCLNRPTRHD
jgi:hypothetical protein